jgi:hypothetical protein
LGKERAIIPNLQKCVNNPKETLIDKLLAMQEDEQIELVNDLLQDIVLEYHQFNY